MLRFDGSEIETVRDLSGYSGDPVDLAYIAADSLDEPAGLNGVVEGKLSAVPDGEISCGISLHDLVAETDGEQEHEATLTDSFAYGSSTASTAYRLALECMTKRGH